MGEKSEFMKWFLVGCLCLIILTGIGMAMRPAQVAVDRVVMENSFQYSEGKKREIATLEAALAEVDARIEHSTDPYLISNLKSQRSSINAQLKAAKGI